MARLSTKPFWLLSVDDDEFMLPMEGDQGIPADPTKSVCSFLSQPKALEWKSIRFKVQMASLDMSLGLFPTFFLGPVPRHPSSAASPTSSSARAYSWMAD